MRERRLPPSYFERFLVDAIEFAGGHASKRLDGAIRVDRSPDVLVARSRASSQTRRIAPSYERLTFDREVAMRPLREDEAALPQAELAGPGHPLFDALVEFVIQRTEQVMGRGAVFEDPGAEDASLVHHLTGEVVDGNRELVRETLAAASQRGEVFTVAPPRTLYDVIPSTVMPDDTPGAAKGLDDWARNHLFEAPFQEAKVEREREAGITERFLEESFTAQLADVDRQILDAEEEVDSGVSGAQGRLRQAELAKEAYRQRRDERLAMTQRSGKVFRGSVRHLGAALVVPTAVEGNKPVGSKGARFADSDIEAIAVAEATRYEVEERGAHVESTEKDGCGFDLRSTKGDADRRCIEVKGRAAVGLVELTWLEYQKSLELKNEYWLYVVLECATDRPRLYRVQNPAEKLAGAITPALDVRYRIQPDPVIDAAEGTSQ
jgi:hypothetical protein